MGAEMKDATSGGTHRAEMWVTAATETDDLAPHTILLLREFEGYKRGSKELMRRSGVWVEVQVAKAKADIGESERLGIRLGTSVFAGAEKKEEPQAQHVSKGLIGFRVGEEGLCHNVLEDRNRNGFYARRGWINPFVAGELAL